jgi:site-specific DNA recombinase
MKAAIAYVRISDEDQSNFSIQGQQNHIREYADRQGVQVLAYFIDQGKSAKNFDRPQWRELEAFLRQRAGSVQYLIVCKYDRIIRNAAEGLTKIPEMELRHDIRIVSVFETFGLDPESPFFFKMRADLLVTAEFERLVIRDRVRMGRDTALRSGRWIGTAPFGYLNGKDEKGRPMLFVHVDNAKIVRSVFRNYANGTPRMIVESMARKAGWTLRGNGSLERMLSNKLYVGQVYAPAYKGRPAEYVRGIHQAIITEDLFDQVQRRLNNRSLEISPKIIREEFPLRGIIKDDKEHQLTGCLSTGKAGKRYPYYKCNKCGANISAIKAHECFENILKQLSLSAQLRDRLLDKINKAIESKKASVKPTSIKLKRSLGKLEENVRSLEEKFITGQVDLDTYTRWKSTWSKEITEQRIELARLTDLTEGNGGILKPQLTLLEDLHWMWTKASIFQKHDFVRALFPRGLILTKKGYRTPYLLSIFSGNPRQIVGLEIGITAENAVIPSGGPGYSEIEHLIQVLQAIKAA